MTRITRFVLAVILVPLNVTTAQWVDTLPQSVQDGVVWFGDHEEAAMDDWDYPTFLYAGGGIFNSGPTGEIEAVASTDVSHSGTHSARTTIRNAFQAQNGSRAVRLMRWTDRPWDDGGDYFPNPTYFSTWMYFPHTYNPNKYEPWDPGDGGWWNVFQFKSDDSDGVSQPLWTMNVDHDDSLNTMSFYLYTKHNTPASNGQSAPIPIPVSQWVHVEALYEQSDEGRGRIAIWQDGRLILNVANVTTILDDPATWGIGNYTDHIAGGPVAGEASLYFDDAAVSTTRLSGALAPPVVPVPDGVAVGQAPVLAGRGAGAETVDISWDPVGCGSRNFHLLYGDDAALATYTYTGQVCDLSAGGSDSVLIPDPAPGTFVWWIMTGAAGSIEGHHGWGPNRLVRPSQGVGRCGLAGQSTAEDCGA